jgi:hypothetical protein
MLHRAVAASASPEDLLVEFFRGREVGAEV